MINVREITILTHCHATEDCEKVLHAVKNILPANIRNNIVFNKQVLHGHYGNPITIIKTTITSNAEQVLKHIANLMDDTEKTILSVSFDLRYDRRENKLYLRISKQKAYGGKIVIHDSDDVIKLIIRLKGSRRPEKIKEFLREMGLIK
ncbi:Protein of unknown function DUF54 [Staphylothermus marinus F1]|uniref:Exosome protein n=1 Tax=Staphylothermus marinus (strain ATCC 43588 / DSM 3639 / JCM 9404 / F1) TaxID=399550 RepID=A3DMU3_STAMF|nr:RNA-binding domain-containing protein [Staphylothermus marinus]ABN69953.1 Protein of unknown function DUF54 [Staphylothermus marinus F1]